MELSFKRVALLTRRIHVIRQRQLLKRFNQQLKEGSEEIDISAGMALVLWSADFLSGTNVLVQAQVDAIFDSKLGEDVYTFGGLLGCAFSKKPILPVARLFVHDRKFAWVTELNNPMGQEFLDLHTGEIVDFGVALARPPIETIEYNLTSLFAHKMKSYNQMLKAKKEDKDAIRKDSALGIFG